MIMQEYFSMEYYMFFVSSISVFFHNILLLIKLLKCLLNLLILETFYEKILNFLPYIKFNSFFTNDENFLQQQL